jgi:hypothetical protein
MRITHTPLALAALLLVAACGTSPEIVAPESTLKSGGGIGSGHYAGDGTGQMGSGNFVAGDGVGQFGSGNAFADSANTAGRGGVGQFGSGN